MRSFLFVPGDSARKFESAKKTAADALILDLEDSIAPDRKVASQVIEGLGGGPDREVVFGDGLRFHSAVRPGSGPEGAAVVLDKADRVVYAGLIHFNCARVTDVKDSAVAAHLAAHPEKIATSCDNHPTMTIFTKSTLTDAANETFLQWANRQYKSEKITNNVRSLN